MKKTFSLVFVLTVLVGIFAFSTKADAATTTIINGANQITLQSKEIARPQMKVNEGGLLKVAVSVPDKSDIWIEIYDSKQKCILKDSGKWVKNQATGLYDLSMSEIVFPGAYTFVLENTDNNAVSYTMNVILTPAPQLANGKKIDFQLMGNEVKLYRIEATSDGFFNIKVSSCPKGNPYLFYGYLFDIAGNQIDDDDADPDWNTTTGKMSWDTVKVKKGTYYLKICNDSGDYYSSDVTATFKVPAKKVKLNKTKITLKKKKTFKIKTTLTPKYSTDTLKYKSSSKKVATVSKTGKVTAKKAGKAVITVTATSGKKAKLTVTVK